MKKVERVNSEKFQAATLDQNLTNYTQSLNFKKIYRKTMEQKDDIIAILKRFDVVTKQLVLLVTQQSTIEGKRVFLHCTIAMSNVH